MTETVEGGCACGQVRFRMTSAPIVVNCCHCRDCQRISGSAFALNAMIETDRVEVTKGAPVESSLDRDGSGTTRAWRCGNCETLLYADHPMVGDAMRFVRIGTLDRAERLSPDVHFFNRSKHPWVIVPDDVPSFETLPEDHGVGAELDADRQARLAAAFG